MNWLPLLVCPLVLSLPGDQELTLRTNVREVEVSLVATDAKGAPVEGLDVHDFRVWDNGKEQSIARFEKIGVSSAAAPAGPLPPNTYSNRIGQAGAIGFGKTARPQVLSMILLDAVNTKFRNQTVARQAVENIIDHLQPEERVAIYAFGSNLRIIHDFSSDRASLLARLRAYHGESPLRDSLLEDLDLGTAAGADTPGNAPCLARTAPETPFELQAKNARILDTLEALESIANHVKGVPGRKNLLWVSAAFPMAIGQLALRGPIIAPSANSGRRSPYEDLRTYGNELNQTLAVLNDANVSVYPIDARGLSCNPDAAINIDTMRDIADATGGKAFYNRNDIATGVRASLDDSHEVYLLAYSPHPLVENGAYHRIRVQSARPGVHLRYRRGYYAPGGDQPDSAGIADRLTEVVSSPLDASEIGIEASVERSADEINLVIHVDPADLNLTPAGGKWTGSLRLEGMQIGATGERLGGVHQAAKIDLEQATYQRVLQQGLPFEMKFKREPAAVAVRIGVVDARGGHAGSLSVRLPPLR